MNEERDRSFIDDEMTAKLQEVLTHLQVHFPNFKWEVYATNQITSPVALAGRFEALPVLEVHLLSQQELIYRPFYTFEEGPVWGKTTAKDIMRVALLFEAEARDASGTALQRMIYDAYIVSTLERLNIAMTVPD